MRSVLKNKYVRKISILLELVGSQVWIKNLILKRPLGNSNDLCLLLRSELEDLELPGSVDDISITISDFVGEHGIQYRAFKEIHDHLDGQRDQLIKVDRHIRKKIPAKNSLYKLLTVNAEHPVPERRALQISIDPDTEFSVRSINLPQKITVQEVNNTPKFLSLPNGDNLKVKVLDIWKIDLWWIPDPISRTYYSISTSDHKIMTIFKDSVGKRWYRQNY
jgi:hypothetical protein